MKLKFFYYVICFLLLGNLMITQVGVNFFHNHSEHSTTENKNEFKSLIKENKGTCKICQLDLCQDLFFLDYPVLCIIIAFILFFLTLHVAACEQPPCYNSNRAPPSRLV